jgi:hypothetical protein
MPMNEQIQDEHGVMVTGERANAVLKRTGKRKKVMIGIVGGVVLVGGVLSFFLNRGKVDASKLKVGDCISVPGIGRVNAVVRMECSKAHTGQVYALVDLAPRQIAKTACDNLALSIIKSRVESAHGDVTEISMSRSGNAPSNAICIVRFPTPQTGSIVNAP